MLALFACKRRLFADNVIKKHSTSRKSALSCLNFTDAVYGWIKDMRGTENISNLATENRFDLIIGPYTNATHDFPHIFFEINHVPSPTPVRY